MSTSIGNNLLHKNFLSPTVLDHQSRINTSTCIGGNSFFQPQVNSLIRRSPLLTEFHGTRLTMLKKKLQMGKQQSVSRSPQAVLAADPSPEVKLLNIIVYSYVMCAL